MSNVPILGAPTGALTRIGRAIRFAGANPIPDPRVSRHGPVHTGRDRIVVLDTVTLTLTTSDGTTLEAVLDVAPAAKELLVMCHPHPEHGGTMNAPILKAISKQAVAAGVSVLRFNFRGVGNSTGSFGGGSKEIHDVSAAVEWADTAAMTVRGIAGWSFGAAVALNWQASTGSTVDYVGIAPPVASDLTPPLPDPVDLAPADRTFIIGARDQFVDAGELEEYGASIGAATIVYPSVDHFFVFRHDRLATDTVGALTGHDHA